MSPTPQPVETPHRQEYIVDPLATSRDFRAFASPDRFYWLRVRLALAQLEAVLGRFGREAASAAIRTLPVADDVETEKRRALLDAGDWPAVLGHDGVSIDCMVDWDKFDSGDLSQLRDFAYDGQFPGPTPEESRSKILALLNRFRSLKSISVDACEIESEIWIWIAYAAAEARWALDNGKAVDVDGLACLSNVQSKTVANLIAARALPTDSDGRVPAAVALEYLYKRKDFVRSTWQTERSAVAGAADDKRTLGQQVFVPVASDDQPFLPDVARPSRLGRLQYIIGDKANPEYVEDYWEALDRLAQMPVPRWRRPNSQGHWGLVSAQDGWRRYNKVDLERMAEASSKREA